MSTPLLAGLTPPCTTTSSTPSSYSSSPCSTDCSTLLRSLWTDLSSDVCAVSSSITSWLSSFTSSPSSLKCTSAECRSITHPHRLPIDTYLHWLRYHRRTWLHSIPRPQHQRRKGTFLLHDDESDDEREDDEREQTLIASYHNYKLQREQQRQQYLPTSCTCQRDARHTGTCRNTTLLVAACAGLYQRSSLRHEEFIAPRHLGVATDDVMAPPPTATAPSCHSTEFLSVPSSPHLSSQWSDDDSDVDMTRSTSPIPSPMSHMTRVDSHGHLSMDMVDSESDLESEHEVESVDGDMDPKDSKSALRRRSSIQLFLPGMSRSALLQRLTLETPSSTSPNTSCAPKTRRLVASTPSPIPSSSSSTDVLDQLWSIQDGTQLESMKQSLRVSNNRAIVI